MAYLRDITQVYTQSETELNRQFYVRPPQELRLPEGKILRVVKPLYGVPEAANHWYGTYYRHHIGRLGMKPSTYSPYLLYTTDDKTGFGVVGIQTGDAFFIVNETFTKKEDIKLKEAQFLPKASEQLTHSKPLKFNGGAIRLEADGSITSTQERLCRNLRLIGADRKDLTSSRGVVRKGLNTKAQYIAQRARGSPRTHIRVFVRSW
jgi:hypothetical protein